MNRLSYEMTKQKMNAEQLAKKIRDAGYEIHAETVRNWKREDTQISSEFIKVTARILGITTDELLSDFDIIFIK